MATTRVLLDIFTKKFPDMEVAYTWTKGKNAIRIRLTREAYKQTPPPEKDLVFTYIDDDNWRLETISSFNTSK